MDPSVSEPKQAAASPIAEEIPLPELDPDGSPSGTYGLVDCPPRPEKPDGTLPRKFAHSLRFALPRMIAPAARSLAATPASRGTTEPRSAKEPRSEVSHMLSGNAASPLPAVVFIPKG